MVKREILEKAGYIPVKGRPKQGGTYLNRINVSPELVAALQKKADKMGITLTAARKEAYRQFVEN